jgi:hypothetical protein
MKTRRATWGIGLLAFTLLTSSAAGGQPQPSANYAVFDWTDRVFCATSQGLADWTPFPGGVALTTGGDPVWISFTLDILVPSNTQVNLRPIIDGQMEPFLELVTTNLGLQENRIVTIERLLPLPAGNHSFGMAFVCYPDPAHVRRGWVSVFEVSIGKK